MAKEGFNTAIKNNTFNGGNSGGYRDLQSIQVAVDFIIPAGITKF